MELSHLDTLLSQRTNNGELTLDTTLIDEGNMAVFLKTLPGGTLALKNASHTFYTLSPQSLVIEGTLKDPWTLAAVQGSTLSNARVQMAFRQQGNTLTGAFTLSDAQLVTNTRFAVTLRGELRPDNLLHLFLPEPSDTPVSIVPVINFANNPGLAYLPPLPLFQNGGVKLFDLVFGFGATDNYMFQFASQSGNDWPIAGGVAIKKTGVTFVISRDSSQIATGKSSFHGSIFGTLTIGQDFFVSIAIQSPTLWVLEVIPSNGNILPGLEDLAYFIGGADLQKTIAGGLKAVDLDTIAIDGVKIAFNYQDKKLNYIAIRSHITIAGVQINVATQLPDFQLAGSLAPGNTISIKAMVQHFFGVSDKIPEININRLNASMYPKMGIYALDCTISTDWSYEISSGKSLSLQQVAFSIQKSAAGVSGGIAAVLGIAGVNLSVSASNTKEGNTSAWAFEAKTVEGSAIPIGKLADDLLSLFNVSLPDSIKDATLSDLVISFNTGSGNFHFGCKATIPFSSGEVDAELNIQLTKTTNGYDKDITGKLFIANSEFDFHLDNNNTATYFIASLQQKDTSFHIHDAIQKLSPDLANLVPDSFTITINNAEIAIMKNATGTTFLFGLGIGISADLGSIPLVGSLLASAHTLSFDNLQLYFASGDFTQQQIAAFNSPLLPKTAVTKGFLVDAGLSLGGTPTTLSLPVSSQPAAPATGAVVTTNAPAPTAAQSSVRWFNIQRSLGPLSFQRVGVRYEAGSIWFLLDLSVAFSGLTFSLRGLAAGSPLDHFDLKFHLSGMGLSYESGSIAIKGAFLEVDPSADRQETFHYDGAAVLQLPGFTLGAIGSFSNPFKQPSMFIFAELDAEIGGPPYFFVTGFVGGFGYNSQVNLPDQDQVVQFPFVQGLQGQTDPMAVLDILEGRSGGKTWVQSAIGNNWFALGIHFTSFEIIQGKALLLAEFGEQLEIALLGIASVKLPQGAPQLYAFVEMGLAARFIPAEGFFGLSAVVSRNSFVIDPACRLTGGFALYTWFGNSPHADDFVITVGGYHPQFSKPGWYPAEDRLGFSWQVSNLVSISGQAYFALTPSCVMGGGGINVQFHDGNLSAWFMAYANFLIYWKPFSFTVDFGVSIGVAYKMNILGISKTFTLELSASVSMWGPPTGGRAHITWYIISFTVEFGEQNKAGGGNLKWDDFKEMLPAETEICKLRISKGLQNQVKIDDNNNRWIVRADELEFSAESAVPALRIQTNSQTKAVALTAGELPEYNIRPMGVSKADSYQTFYITDPDGNEIDVHAAGWNVQTINRNVPEALWGKPLDAPPPPSASLVPGKSTGMNLKVPQPMAGYSPGSIDMEKDLSYEPLEPEGILPLSPAAAVDPTVPAASDTTVSLIFTELMNAGVVTNRTGIYNVLNANGVYTGSNEALTNTAAAAGSNFIEEPFLTA